jgi:hypothetical protein
LRIARFTQVLLIVTLVACREEGRGPGGDGPPPAQVGISTAAPGSDDEGTLDRLIDSLRLLPGRFELLPENRWTFIGSSTLFVEFVPFADSAVVRLVDCLDAPGEGNAIADGRRVPIGVLCSWALRHVASFESGEEDEVNGTWPGSVEPTATRPQLEAAGRAWRLVVEQHRYRLN